MCKKSKEFLGLKKGCNFIDINKKILHLQSPKFTKKMAFIFKIIQDNSTTFFTDCVAGWALRSSNDCALTFHHVWASGQIQIANYTLEHVDPSVQIIAFKVSLQQVHSALNEVFNIQVDTKAR